MSILLFIIILGALIFVHELGHFLVAKYTGMRVDAFALGFPPTLWKKKINGTEYKLNLIPFGGYVSIFGENPDDVSTDKDVEDSFTSKNRGSQAIVLVAGVTFNILFAWVLLFIALLSGFASPVALPGIDSEDTGVIVNNFTNENTPAEISGLMIDDQILSLAIDENKIEVVIPEQVVSFVQESNGEVIDVEVLRNDETMVISVIPDSESKIGTSLKYVTLSSIPIPSAFIKSFLFTGYLVRETTIGLIAFFGDLFILQADMETVSGPIGIAGLVEEAAEVGLSFVLVFTALISINLAIINLLPIPALDGGRLLFVAIEAIIRKPINYKFQVWANTIGFSVLMLLMILLTVSDVGKLF